MSTVTTTDVDLAELANIDDQEYQGFKVGDLRTAFTEIHNKENWKLRIHARVKGVDFPKYNAAAIFFAGSPLKVTAIWEDGTVDVYGDGYYQCIGA